MKNPASRGIKRPLEAMGRPLGVSEAPMVETTQKALSTTPKRPPRRRRPSIKYRAAQVIMRPRGHLPMGSSIKGRLLTALDTRYPDRMAKVILPVDAEFDGGGGPAC